MGCIITDLIIMRPQLFPALLAALFVLSGAPALARPAFAERSDCAMPERPKGMLDRSEQGTVTVALLVQADGSVSDAKVVRSSGYPQLDAAAREAMARCTYTPLQIDGRPQMGWQMQQYTWKAEAVR